MTALVSFLREQIEVDRRAVAAILRESAPWRVDVEPWVQGVGVVDRRDDSIAVAIGGYVAEHISRWDPARVLAECEAKLAVIERYESTQVTIDAAEGTVLAGAAKLRRRVYYEVLQLLALPYSDRPGYLDEWRPE